MIELGLAAPQLRQSQRAAGFEAERGEAPPVLGQIRARRLDGIAAADLHLSGDATKPVISRGVRIEKA